MIPSRDVTLFLQQLPATGRVLGVDLGTKTIGLALSDERRQIASPLETISRRKFSQDAAQLAEIITRYQICGLVLGYPVHMDGSEGARCQSTRQFMRSFNQYLEENQSNAVPVLLWDERMSSMAVERTMLAADLSRQRRSELVDKLAAAYILQGVLDSNLRVES
jgi:putative Holliday junction resolvase